LLRVSVKSAADVVAVPPVVVMGPEVAPGMTNRRREVLVLSKSRQAVPFTATALTRFKLLPLSVTSVPTLPDAGENEVIVCARKIADCPRSREKRKP
jgi:hypothetical protein